MTRLRVLAAGSLVALMIPAFAIAGEPGWHLIKYDVVLVCKNQKDFELLSETKSSGDTEAFKKMAAVGISTGLCSVMRRGDEVYLVDTAGWGTLAKIRKRGDVVTYWTDAGYLN